MWEDTADRSADPQESMHLFTCRNEIYDLAVYTSYDASSIYYLLHFVFEPVSS